MKYIKTFLLILFLGVGAVMLHYYLPSRDIVQIVGTDVKRIDVGGKAWFWDRPDTGTNENSTRDVRFINTVKPNGKPRVYRNEDTGWSFPPYFKFDSGDLNAEAQILSKKDDVWVAVSHYGWRVKLFSIFPNAYSIKVVDGPKTRLIPWFNIAFLALIFFIIFTIWRFIRRLKKRHVDPVTDRIEKAADAAQDEASEQSEKAKSFFRRWFGTSKKL